MADGVDAERSLQYKHVADQTGDKNASPEIVPEQRHKTGEYEAYKKSEWYIVFMLQANERIGPEILNAVQIDKLAIARTALSEKPSHVGEEEPTTDVIRITILIFVAMIACRDAQAGRPPHKECQK